MLEESEFIWLKRKIAHAKIENKILAMVYPNPDNMLIKMH